MAPEASNTNVATSTAVRGKKKKGMKRLKGLITGKSRRQMKKNAQSQSQTSLPDNNSIPVDTIDDSSTVYGAELDSVMEKSTSSASLSTAKSTIFADPVQVILLIMDPDTRRFELLQLEFDSAMAKVSDIYKQIPTAATEEVLQKASYKAIITAKGEELKSDSNLSDYVTGAAVVIAVPESTDASLEKCATMAAPILTNSKVHKMLISAGVKVEDLPEKPKKVKRSVVAPAETPAAPEPALTPEEPKVEEAKTEETLKPIEETKPKETPTEKATEEKPKPESSNNFAIGLIFAVFAHLFIRAHSCISTPLAPGSTMGIGKTKSQCGLLGSLPFYSCGPKSMTMGTDGVLKVYEGDEVVFSLSGGVCDENDEECSNGVVIQEDGTLLIGGEKAKAKSKSKTTTELTPWPFSEDLVFKTGFF